MEFELVNAIIAGLVATAAMTALMYMGFAMGMKMDMPMMLGTIVLPRGQAAWVLGLMMHLMMGAAFFVGYAVLFEALAIGDTLVIWGALFGLAHGALAGAMMGVMPAMHPRMAASTSGAAGHDVPAPGFFGIGVSALAPMAILVMHALYGGLGGAVYSL